jgi:hypothetical protein
MVLNAPVGACAKRLALKGPLTTISSGDASGLCALAEAAHLLATRDDLDRVVAGGVEEDRSAPDPCTIEGAVCVVLTAEPPIGPRIRLVRCGLAGPDDLEEACRAALADPTGVAAGDRTVHLVVGDRVPWVASRQVLEPELYGGAAASMLSFALAVAALRRGDARTALVVSRPNPSIACALQLAVEDP